MIVPKLRFPEFMDSKGWTEKTLEKLTEKIGDGIHTTPIYDETGDYYFINGNNLIDGIICLDEKGKRVSDDEYTKHQKGLNENTILLSINGTIGNIALYNNEKVVLGKSACYINTSNDLEKYFLYYLIQTDKVKSYFQSELTGSTIKNLSLKSIREAIIHFPNKIEQQKIASCLSSLDELIAAQIQKLDVLKAHKKGLMQQLFPAEGETMPKLRFKEFKDSGEWEEKALVNALLTHPEYGLNAAAVPYSKNLPTYLRITDISEDGIFIKENKVSVEKEVTEDNYLEEGDIVLARTGASVGKSYKYRAEDGPLVFAGFLIRIRPDNLKLNSELLYQFLSTDRFWKWVAFTSQRSGQPGINGNEYASLQIPYPPKIKEQQKIADCLSSLDELITAQTKKIAALKVHKRGLMQGLFPSPEGAV